MNRFDLPVLEITMWIVMDDDRRLTNYDYKNNRNLDIENVLPGRRTTRFRNNNNIGSSHDIAENVWLGIQRHVVVCLKPTQHIVYNIKLIRGVFLLQAVVIRSKITRTLAAHNAFRIY